MTITQELEIAKQRTGGSVTLPIPPACTALLNRARAEAIPLERLYVVSSPLREDVWGAYERATGDAWCYAAPDDEDHKGLLQQLLILLAQAKLCLPAASTLEEAWEQEEAVVEQAYELGQKWQMPNLFPLAEKEARTQELERQYDRLLLSAEVAGTCTPQIARLAYSVLDEARIRRGWSEEQFWGVLLGEAGMAALGFDGDPKLEATILQFDRTKLRSRWKVADRLQHEGDRFEDFALPQTQNSRRLLRSALWHCAKSSPRSLPLPTLERKWFDDPLHLHFLQIESDLELPQLLDLVNMWLIEDHINAYAEVMWWCYADRTKTASPRLYRLMVHYQPSPRSSQPQKTPLVGHELWVLFLPGHRRALVEAAFQEFIRSWLGDVQELRCERLSDGLQMLWSWMSGF